MACARGAALVALGIFLSARVSTATVFFPITEEELARTANAVIIGTVERLTGVESRAGDIFTLVDVEVEEVLKGSIPGPVITLKEEGGIVAERHRVVFGTPEFHVGERVLLFLAVHADGSLRTNHLALGKFRLGLDAEGLTEGQRHFGRGTTLVVLPDARPLRAHVPLDELRRAIARGRTLGARPARWSSVRAEPPEARDPSLRRQAAAQLNTPEARFFEADEGVPITFVIDEAHDSFLGMMPARQAWEAALAAWTVVPTATISLKSGLDQPPEPWEPSLAFAPDPFGSNGQCGTVAGVGGWTANTAEVKVFHGSRFIRITDAAVTIYTEEGGTCPLYTQCNVAEVATHELGHAIGLEHSNDRDATMNSAPHHDCRCAALRGDDADAVSFLYPAAIPPTISTPPALGDAIVGEAYRQLLVAIGGAGRFTWTFATNGFNPDTDDFGSDFRLSGDGVLTGTPRDPGENSALIKATDTNGDSHTKRFMLTVRPADAPTTTISTTTTTTSTTTGPTAPIECMLPTTTTVPPWCDAAPTFVGIYCKIGEAEQLVEAFAHRRARARRLLVRLDAAASAADAAVYTTQPKYRQARRLLERAERHGRALVKLAGRPRFIDAVGAPDAAALEALAEALVARVIATRDDLPRRPCLQPRGGCSRDAACPKGTECAAGSGRSICAPRGSDCFSDADCDMGSSCDLSLVHTDHVHVVAHGICVCSFLSESTN